MKGLVYLILLSAFMLGACAHLDNGFMRSAEPLPKGGSRGFASVSSSYSYTPGLNFEPDGTLGLNSRPNAVQRIQTWVSSYRQDWTSEWVKDSRSGGSCLSLLGRILTTMNSLKTVIPLFPSPMPFAAMCLTCLY